MRNNILKIASKVLLICTFSIILNSLYTDICPKAICLQENISSVDDNLIERILRSKSDLFGEILNNPDKYEVQIMYTQIDRDKSDGIKFNTFRYNVDKDKYFYPASSVKLSACALALEKLNNLNINKYTPLKIGKERSSQTQVKYDFSSSNSCPSIANYIKKVLVISDNEGFDRLYEFLGQEYYNETLWKKGYKDTLILHRLENIMNDEENRYTNSFTFYRNKDTIYQQPVAYNSKNYSNNLKTLTKGKGYYNGKTFIKSPKDFSKSNYFSIECLQGIIKSIIFPESIPEDERFNLKEEDYKFLRRYMSMLPRECDNPKCNFKDSHVKYFMFGDSNGAIPDNIKIYNKSGCAYGYLIDNAYIIDKTKGIEFMLTSVIYTNSNEIFNDNKYEYNNIGIPFLSNLGKVIYEYEANGRNI